MSAPLRPRRRGFTLIELLVVLAIVATLITLVAPRLFGKVDAAKEAVLLHNLQTTREVIGKFYGDQGRYPESLDELVERKYLAALPWDPILESDAAWSLTEAPEGSQGKVSDLHSAAPGQGSDGRDYAQW